MIGSRGFLFLVIGPHKPAPGPFDLRLRLGKYFRLSDGIGPRQTRPWPLRLALRVDWIMCFAHLQWVPGVFVFSGEPVRGRWGRGGQDARPTDYSTLSIARVLSIDPLERIDGGSSLLDGGESSSGNSFPSLPDRSPGNAASSRWAVDFGL